MITEFNSNNNPFIKRDFGSVSSEFGDGQILAFEFDADAQKTITMISASFRRPLDANAKFYQSAIAIVKGRVTSTIVDLPYNINQLQAERLVLLRFFNAFDGIDMPYWSTGARNEVLSVVLFPAILESNTNEPVALYGTLNVVGSFNNENTLFKPVI